jgi:hypothetical protein
MSTDWLGVILAIAASISNNFGIVLQKKVVNAVPSEARGKKFFRTIAKRPLWLLGIFMQMGISSACLLSAQFLIGPTLVPGLQGIGLIVLVIGSIRMNNETLLFPEYVGIFLLIIATGLIGFSELHIKVSEFDYQQVGFFKDAIMFSIVLLVSFLLLEVGQRNSDRFVKGMLLSIISGFLYALSDFWISPLVGTVGVVFKLQSNWTQGALFLLACGFLISTNILAIGKTQLAFKYGPASILIPIRHVPTLVSPIFVYYFVYNMTAPKCYSIWYFLISIVLIIISSYLLGKKEGRFVNDGLVVDPE